MQQLPELDANTQKTEAVIGQCDYMTKLLGSKENDRHSEWTDSRTGQNTCWLCL